MSERAARRGEDWRSLQELTGGPEASARLPEFPEGASDWMDGVGRREFLKLMGASLALGGLAGCSSPSDTILPYAQQPEQVVPGQPLFYATAMTLGGFATGLLVESQMGRPTKAEGNPTHPASLGATDVFAQASILGLYDPDRSQNVVHNGVVSTWERLTAILADVVGAQQATRGAGLRLLTETVTSPTLAAQLRALLQRYPNARWHQYEPVGRDAVHAGARLAFGQVVNPVYRVDKAAVILSLGADFLASGPGCVRYAREFAAGRQVRSPKDGMNRLYVAEPTPSPTGSIADHRLPVRASELEAFARAVARRLGVQGAGGQAQAFPQHAGWLDAVAKDLQAHRGHSLVVAGDEQPALVHALAHAMNQHLDNVGQTVLYTDPVEAEPLDQLDSLRALAADMQAGTVEALVILGGNPVYTAPADLRFDQALRKVGLRAHLSLYQDETSALCQWHVPETHFLESWSDARAFDGTVSVIQPLIAPLTPSRRSPHEVLAVLLGDPTRTPYEVVRGYWRGRAGAVDFETFWRKALHDGVIPNTAAAPRAVSLRPGALGQPAAAPPAGPAGSLEILFRPDPAVWDGRFANNGWLQELPKPLTTLTWDNALLLPPETARRLGVASEDVVEVTRGDRSLRATVWVMPGHAPDSCTLHLGYGRQRAGRVGSGQGANAYALRTADAMWIATGAGLRRTGERARLAATHAHHGLGGRPLVRSAPLGEYRKHPDFAHEAVHAPARDETLYGNYAYEGYAWGMAIDLSACTGCSACVVACQAENNIPIVGKEQVLRGREMHWLRIDHYYQGEAADPETVNMPVPCMHCENAPCEPVCPVGATVHSSEGLNDMVYNRCVGTRYCSNNCPYKVRRFNFLQYSDQRPLIQLLHNPEVTVRSRGVMEKCTYCVQRISRARITAEREGRSVRDGEVVTACQAACPTQAIVFGNVNDAKSRVAQLKASSLNYGLLAELNTRPRTTYLSKLRNPNPAIEAA